MSDNRLRIDRLADIAVSPSGALRFTIVGDNDAAVPAEIALDAVPTVVTHLIVGAARGAEMLGLEGPGIDEAYGPVEAIPLRGIGIEHRPQDNGCNLILRLPGFWLSFAVESTEMGEFAGRLAEIARLLATQGRA